VLDVCEEPSGQKRSDAQDTVELMVLGNWSLPLRNARANDIKSAVFDKKQAFSDKKMPFRHLLRVVRCSGQ
jgi:hypothetical protein